MAAEVLEGHPGRGDDEKTVEGGGWRVNQNYKPSEKREKERKGGAQQDESKGGHMDEPPDRAKEKDQPNDP